jgi:hypothetical protein
MVIILAFFFAYIGIAVESYKLVECSKETQKCYEIVRAEPVTLCPTDNVVPFQVEILMNMPAEGHVSIAPIKNAEFSTLGSSASFGSLNVDVSFKYPDGRVSDTMVGMGYEKQFKCLIDGTFKVTDEQEVANIAGSMMNNKPFDVVATINVPIM